MASWNPFSRFSLSVKQKLVPPSELKEIEKQKLELSHLEKICKKLCQDLKKLQDSLNTVPRTNTRIAQNLNLYLSQDADLQRMTEIWTKTAEQDEIYSSDLSRNIKVTCSDPLKRLMETFSTWHTALKKWDSNFQEYAKAYSKVERLQSKEKSPANLEKLEQASIALETSKKEFDSHHNVLKNELKRFQNDRLTVMLPSFHALIQYQLSHYKQSESVCLALCRDTQTSRIPVSDEAYKELIQEKLKDIKALSIVASD